MGNPELCVAAAANKKGLTRTGAKLGWVNCTTTISPVKTWNFNETTSQIESIETSQILTRKKKDKGKTHCWSLNRKEIKEDMKTIHGFLRLKICDIEDVRQKFKFEDGQIWLDFVLDNKKEYCVVVGREKSSLRLSACYASLV